MELNIETVDINSIFQDPQNARLHSDKQLDELAKSWSRFGQQKPILVGKDNIIITGNGQHLAARDILKWKEIAIVRCDLPAEEARAFAIADNQLGSNSEWDLDVLSKQMKELSEWKPMQDWSSIGFDNEEIQPLLEAVAVDENAENSQALADYLEGRDVEAPEKEQSQEMAKPIKLTKDMRETVDTAIQIVRLQEGDMDISEGRVIELICADFLSGSVKPDKNTEN